MIFLKEKAPSGLEACIHQITISYIESRLAMAEMAARPEMQGDEFADPLEQEVLRSEQLEVLANLGRCKYQEVATVVTKHFEDTMARGKDGRYPQEVFYRKIAWLVYMIGALISGHSSSSSRASRGGEAGGAGEGKAPGEAVGCGSGGSGVGRERGEERRGVAGGVGKAGEGCGRGLEEGRLPRFCKGLLKSFVTTNHIMDHG